MTVETWGGPPAEWNYLTFTKSPSALITTTTSREREQTRPPLGSHPQHHPQSVLSEQGRHSKGIWEAIGMAILHCLNKTGIQWKFGRRWKSPIWIVSQRQSICGMDMVITRPHFGPVKGVDDGGKQSLTVYHHWKRVLTAQEGRVRCAMHADRGRQSVRSHIDTL